MTAPSDMAVADIAQPDVARADIAATWRAPAQAPQIRRLSPDAPARWGPMLGPALLLLYWTVLSVTGFLDPRVLPAPWTAVPQLKNATITMTRKKS